jgi:hypothetical protein
VLEATLNRSFGIGIRGRILMADAEERHRSLDRTDERDRELIEHLDRAHASTIEALEAIEEIRRQLRFPGAASVRVDTHEPDPD